MSFGSSWDNSYTKIFILISSPVLLLANQAYAKTLQGSEISRPKRGSTRGSNVYAWYMAYTSKWYMVQVDICFRMVYPSGCYMLGVLAHFKLFYHSLFFYCLFVCFGLFFVLLCFCCFFGGWGVLVYWVTEDR